MEQVDCVLQKVVIEVFVHVQQKLQTYFFGKKSLFNSHSQILDVSVDVVSLHIH